MEENKSKGILDNIEDSLRFSKVLLSSVADLAKSDDNFSENSFEKIKEIVIGIKKIHDKLNNVPVSLDKSYEIIKDIINHVHESRSKLKGTVDGLIKKTGEQIVKVTSATEVATNKILDVSDKLTEKQNTLIDKLDKIIESKPDLESFVDEMKNDIYSQQDDTFMILDHLQFQDITSQQLEGAFEMVNQIEDKLLAVAKLLEGLDDLTFEKLAKRNTSFDSDAEFKDQSETQNSIDDIFSGKSISPESQIIEEKKPEPIIEKKETTPPSTENLQNRGEEISKLFEGAKKENQEEKAKIVSPPAEQPVTTKTVSQADIDALMTASKPKPKEKTSAAVSQAEIDKLLAASQNNTPTKKEISKPAMSQADIDALMNKPATPVKQTKKKENSSGAISQAEIDKLMSGFNN